MMGIDRMSQRVEEHGRRVFDFGIWMLEFGLRTGTHPSSKQSKIQNPKSKIIIALAVTFVIFTWINPWAKSHAASQGDAGTTTAAFLELGVGGRPSAMGEAYVAVHGRSDVLGFNPSGIATLTRPVVYFSHEQLIQDLNFNHVHYAQPWREKEAFAFSVLVLDLGDFTRTGC